LSSRLNRRPRRQAIVTIFRDHWCGESISLAHYSFYETRPLWVIPQHDPDLPDRNIDAVIDVNENVLAPKPFCNLLAGNQLTPTLDQQNEQLHWKFFKGKSAFTSLQPESGLVECEIGEMEL